MPIEEKPQLLEFNCTLDEFPDILWNVKYDPNNNVQGLHVTGNGQNFHCPVELFKEITDFLQSKNVIKPQTTMRSLNNSFTHTSELKKSSSLRPPVIEESKPKPKSNTSDTPFAKSPPMDALASFDITINDTESEKLEAPKTDIKNNGQPEIKSPSPVNEVEKDIDTSKNEDEVINRPVIRTRVREGDPQSAEKEAAMLRKKNSKKTIKRKHKEENE